MKVAVLEAFGMVDMACDNHHFGPLCQSFANQFFEKIISSHVFRQMGHHLSVAEGAIAVDNFFLVAPTELNGFDFDGSGHSCNRRQSLLNESRWTCEPIQYVLETVGPVGSGRQTNNVFRSKQWTHVHQALRRNVMHFVKNDSAKA